MVAGRRLAVLGLDGLGPRSLAGGEPWTVGARLRVGHRPWTFDCVLVEARPPERVVWVGRGAGIEGRHAIRFLPHPDGCLVEMSETFTGRGARLLRPLVRWFWGYQLRALRHHLAEPARNRRHTPAR